MDKLKNLLNKKRKSPNLNKELSTSSASTFNKNNEKTENYLKIKRHDILFKNNPNFKFKEKIIDNNDSLGNDLF